jgi:hypothetical protein
MASTPLHQQQPTYYNEADGQYYYYNDSDGNYYTQTGQMWTSSYEEQRQSDQSYMNQPNDSPSLIIDNFQEEMSQFAPTGIDYLSLARERAANKVRSYNSASTDGDWMALAEEKRLRGSPEGDGWEVSFNDEGSGNDAASLGLGIYTTEGGIVVDNGGEGDEPQLLL